MYTVCPGYPRLAEGQLVCVLSELRLCIGYIERSVEQSHVLHEADVCQAFSSKSLRNLAMHMQMKVWVLLD